MDVKAVGEKLVSLCREGKNMEAIDALYGDDITSVEAQGNEAMPAVMQGIDAIRGKNQWWLENHEIHSASVEGPWVNGDRFTVMYDFDVTPKQGERMQMKEVALYAVEGGKIVREEFYY